MHARCPKGPNQACERGAVGQREHKQANAKLALAHPAAAIVLIIALPAHQPWRTARLAQVGARKLEKEKVIEQEKPGTWMGLGTTRHDCSFRRLVANMSQDPGEDSSDLVCCGGFKRAWAKASYPIISPFFGPPRLK